MLPEVDGQDGNALAQAERVVGVLGTRHTVQHRAAHPPQHFQNFNNTS